jgi:hypothetical protein
MPINDSLFDALLDLALVIYGPILALVGNIFRPASIQELVCTGDIQCGRSKPAIHRGGLAVYVAHRSDLIVPLRCVALIDA